MKDVDFKALMEAIESPRVELTLPDVLAIRDDRTFANEIICLVCATEHTMLRPIERVVYLVSDCSFRLARGGITDFLLQAEHRDEALEALRTIGALREERILRRGAKLFDDIAPEDRERARTIGELIALAGNEPVHALNDEVGDGGEMREHLCDYIIEHRSAFAVDC